MLLRETFDTNFPEKTIGIGGVFTIQNATIYGHVMPDFLGVILILTLIETERYVMQGRCRRMAGEI